MIRAMCPTYESGYAMARSASHALKPYTWGTM